MDLPNLEHSMPILFEEVMPLSQNLKVLICAVVKRRKEKLPKKQKHESKHVAKHVVKHVAMFAEIKVGEICLLLLLEFLVLVLVPEEAILLYLTQIIAMMNIIVVMIKL